MAQGKEYGERKEQMWRRWIEEWRASDLTVRAFCGRHGLAVRSFYTWRRLLQQRQAETAAFVPVHVVGEEPNASGAALEIVLPLGRTVRVTPGFDAGTLRQLLAILEERQPC